MSNARPLLRRCFAISLGLLVVPIPVITHAQTNVQIQTPVQRLSDHYYEYTGSSWFMGGFNNGGFGPPPPFGDYAGGGSTFGFGGGGWGFNFLAAQGSSRSYVAQAPSVTLIPGTFGSFQDLTMRPFVTGQTMEFRQPVHPGTPSRCGITCKSGECSGQLSCSRRKPMSSSDRLPPVRMTTRRYG